MTPDGEYVYVVNTGAGAPAGPTPSIARFNLADDGGLAFNGLTSSPDDFAETDTVISVDGKYLYVLAPSVGNPAAPASHIDAYKIKGNGSLKSIGSTKARRRPRDRSNRSGGGLAGPQGGPADHADDPHT